MTSNLDSPDFTSLGTRAMLSLAQSPLVSTTAGWQSAVVDVALWARSLNLLVQNNTNVIVLSVTGVSTGFVYLNAMPAYDGGIYYIPAMPVIDTQVTVTWYQVAVTSTSIYLIASDEPISVSLFNPLTATQSLSERLFYGMPLGLANNVTNTNTVTLDTTTAAIRITVDKPQNCQWGKVVGHASGTVYYDGTAAGKMFPETPIPIDRTLDASVDISVRTTFSGTGNLYVTGINVPDYAGATALTQAMSPNELTPLSQDINTPNQQTANYNGTLASLATQHLVGASVNLQLRLHQLVIISASTTTNVVTVQDTTGFVYFTHRDTVAYALVIPLFGMLAAKGAGIDIVNATALLSGVFDFNLYYSVI